MERWVLGISLLLFLVLAFFRPATIWPLRLWLDGGEESGLASWRIEEEALKARLAVLEATQRDIARLPNEGIRASIFVRYPFNLKNEILLDAGEKEGVGNGRGVVVPANGPDPAVVFLGRIRETFPETALVQTIFDSRTQLGVRVGNAGGEALLVGGSRPKLTLIPKSVTVRSGDVVYLATQDLPYGLTVGSVREVKMAPDGLLQEATLDLPYDLNQLRTVVILAP